MTEEGSRRYVSGEIRGRSAQRGAVRLLVHSWWGVGAWCLLLVGLAYGDALALPFFFDDFVHLPYVDEYSLLEMWQTAGTLAYYRPLSFVIWKTMSFATDGHSPLLQHTLNLLLHLGNGVLVAWLARSLWRKEAADEQSWLRPYLSATLFLLFPFSYQAVPWIGSLSHLLVTFLILASLAGYRQRQHGGARRWLALSLVTAGLAPFAHENGALVGPLVGLVALTNPGRIRWARAARDGLAWTVPALLWLPIWWLAPKALSGNVQLNGGEALLQNSVYFLQGLAYPLTWLGGPLRARLSWNDLLVAGGLTLVALGAALALQWTLWPGLRRRSLLPWLWYGLAALPAVLFLRFDYVINGPRLLMVASVGAAWLWADVGCRLAQLGRSGWRLAGGALLLLVLAQNVSYVRARMDEHRQLGNLVKEATAQTVAANAAQREAVFVNFPSWLAPASNSYALGHEGPLFWPDYARPEALVSTQTGAPARLRFARYNAIRTETAYHVGLTGGGPAWESIAANHGRVFVARYGPEEIELLPAGGFPAKWPEALSRAIFESQQGQVSLLAATISQEEEAVQLTLTWQTTQPPEADVTALVHLLDAEGQLVAQADGDPLAGTYPLTLWPPGQVVEDVRYLPAAAAGGEIRVGLYRRGSGERLSARTAAGTILPEGVLSLPLSP